MNKQQKKALLKEANDLNLRPNEYYSAGQFGVSGTWYIWTDVNGKAVDVTLNPDEHEVKRKEKEFKKVEAEQIKERDRTKHKKEVKSKQELDELKKDPTVLQGQLDDKFIKFQELEKKMDDWFVDATAKDGKRLFGLDDKKVLDKKNPAHASGRVLNRKRERAQRDLYDTAKIYNSIKKEDDPTDYYGEVVQAITDMPVTSFEDPSKIKSLPEGFVSETRIPAKDAGRQQRKLSDQEILEKLKLRQK
jgi:hypothetical protein